MDGALSGIGNHQRLAAKVLAALAVVILLAVGTSSAQEASAEVTLRASATPAQSATSECPRTPAIEPFEMRLLLGLLFVLGGLWLIDSLVESWRTERRERAKTVGATVVELAKAENATAAAILKLLSARTGVEDAVQPVTAAILVDHVRRLRNDMNRNMERLNGELNAILEQLETLGRP